MNFSEITQEFQEFVPCIDAYKNVKNGMKELIKDEPEYASAYFIIFGFARSYILLYEDQAVSDEISRKAKDELLEYMKLLDEKIKNGSNSDVLIAMNKITHDYWLGDRIF